MNTGKPPFDDVKVRQAVRYALDYDTLVRKYCLQSAWTAPCTSR